MLVNGWTKVQPPAVPTSGREQLQSARAKTESIRMITPTKTSRVHRLLLGLSGLLLLTVASGAWAQAIPMRIDVNGCKASFAQNQCGGGAMGDICVAANTQPPLRFILPNSGASFVSMSISTGGGCPADAADDFPQLPNCSYTAGGGSAMVIQDDNVHARTWNYSITVAIDGCANSVVDPVINNGGGNSN